MNLLIACNNDTDGNSLACTFSNLEQISVLPVAFSGNAALCRLQSVRVDLLLLDLFLSDMDGLSIVEYVRSLDEKRRPMIFLMTALPDDRLLATLKDVVQYCFVKPLQYDLVQLRVLQMMQSIGPCTQCLAKSSDVLDQQVSLMQHEIGVPAHLKGYYYMRDAIRIYALCDSPVRLNITIDVYPAIAATYHTQPTLVEHAIRNALEITWTRGCIEKIHDYFGYTINDRKGKPSNLEFITMMAERVRRLLS